MDSPVVQWAALAVLVCWLVGAYNRLVRLRAQANAAFATVDVELERQLDLARSCLPVSSPQTVPMPLHAEPASIWDAIAGATVQLQACLADARAKPLDPCRMASLVAARDVLTQAWARAERDDAHDLAGPRLPASLSAQWLQAQAQVHATGDQFDTAVARYNEAIAQFPASLVARLFGFTRAAGLSGVTS